MGVDSDPDSSDQECYVDSMDRPLTLDLIHSSKTQQRHGMELPRNGIRPKKYVDSEGQPVVGIPSDMGSYVDSKGRPLMVRIRSKVRMRRQPKDLSEGLSEKVGMMNLDAPCAP